MSKLDAISLGLIVFAVIVITLGIIKLHTYPGKVAEARKHPQTKAIEVTSLLGLIAFPLWMFALIWAYSDAVIGKLYTAPEDEPATPPPPATTKTPERPSAAKTPPVDKSGAKKPPGATA